MIFYVNPNFLYLKHLQAINHYQTIKKYDKKNILWRIEMNVSAFLDRWTKRFLDSCHFLEIF